MPAVNRAAGGQLLFHGFDATQHSMTNPRIVIAGERASCVMYLQAGHFLRNNEGDAELTVGGNGTDQLVQDSY